MNEKEAEILEQQTQFDRINAVTGTETMSIFLCCVLFDAPYIADCIPSKGGGWQEYMRKLKFRKKDGLGFRGGVTDVLQQIGRASCRERV